LFTKNKVIVHQMLLTKTVKCTIKHLSESRNCCPYKLHMLRYVESLHTYACIATAALAILIFFFWNHFWNCLL